MRVKVTEAFKFAHDGYRVVVVGVGDIVDGRCAEVAMEQKKGLLEPEVLVEVDEATTDGNTTTDETTTKHHKRKK